MSGGVLPFVCLSHSIILKMGIKAVYNASIVASVWNVRSRHVTWKRKAKAITTRSINSINAAGRHCFTLMQKEGGRFVSTN